ncbi:4Fe-4S dicluster domain-containing protein [Halorubrum sp. JWXQ-INN 858]|uniref:4Fe-4S dicluster domain-containing protein n=1 Tax=Halorubrum sp. JWXQ-INN 858 TaxID=2690782 RepID=UPI0013599EC0|nr:4Fe-4S dicluster domain-containing protein [Halorubrum sp. JWXQ-INN 858]MWV65214.1 4Fe-4S dicluster domain-containing protein [Halorubrum sp. JWXQ-INN 858]
MTPLQAATRETFWTIGPIGKAAFYWLAAVAVLVFLYGVYARFASYTQGRSDPQDRLSDLPGRVLAATKTVLSNENQYDRDLYAGVMHTFVLWGFLVLVVATAILGFDIDVYRPLTGGSFWVGDFYLAYQFVVDAFGLLFVVGVGMAIYKRYRNREGRLWGKHTSLEDDAFVWTLFLLGVGGFLVQAIGIVGQPERAGETVSFVGMAMAAGFQWAGLTQAGAEAAYGVIWWHHSLLAFAFIAWIPYAKPFHMISSFANVVARDERAGARLPNVPADLDHTNAESIADFTWKELMDGDACTKCGRCSAACPAKAVGRNLDPRDVILDLKAYRESVSDDPVVGARGSGTAATDGGSTVADGGTVPIVADEGGVIASESMESCMACMACMDACPVDIEHLTSFTRLNRQLTDEGAVDSHLQDVFQDVMRTGNTFGESASARGDWADELEFDLADARETEVEYLWYVGDYPSYDDRNKRVARSLARLFEAADVEFGILFDDEKNDGNDVRRIGEEFLYLELAGHHVETFADCEFDSIVCTDPHSYNTMKNEYPEVDFAEFADDPMMPFDREEPWNADGDVDVLHWTQVVEGLVADGRLGLSGDELDYTVTYHDPCHLGRYNDEYEAPRELIRATGATLFEMPRSREDSFCCGGGGGGLWTEHDEEVKPSEERLREAVEDTDAGDAVEKFVVACPMCTTMFEDGRKTGGFEDDLEVVDVAELLIEALEAGR